MRRLAASLDLTSRPPSRVSRRGSRGTWREAGQRCLEATPTTPRHCTTQRHFVLVLCFHRHSRFVPRILWQTSRGVQTARGQPLPSDLRPETRGRRWPSTLRLSDFLYLSFVFIDILALFPGFCSRQVEVSRSRAAIPAFRRLARGRVVDLWVGNARLSDILYLSFVFIDILALFPRFCS